MNLSGPKKLLIVADLTLNEDIASISILNHDHVLL